MDIIIVPRDQRIPASGISTAYLHVDHWNDFSFITMFYMYLFDQKGERHEIGNVKIGFQGQSTQQSTYSTLGDRFKNSPRRIFFRWSGCRLLSEDFKFTRIRQSFVT